MQTAGRTYLDLYISLGVGALFRSGVIVFVAVELRLPAEHQQANLDHECGEQRV